MLSVIPYAVFLLEGYNFQYTEALSAGYGICRGSV